MRGHRGVRSVHVAAADLLYGLRRRTRGIGHEVGFIYKKSKYPVTTLQYLITLVLKRYELMGLNLLGLLALSRNAEFHVSVEKLPADVLQKNPYIRHPVQLEQFIMEGNYNKASC